MTQISSQAPEARIWPAWFTQDQIDAQLRHEAAGCPRPFEGSAWDGGAYVGCPDAFSVVEFYGKGDPCFGGAADDRPLGVVGEFLSGSYQRLMVQRFTTRELAEAAASRAKSREGSLVGVCRSREENSEVL